MIMRTEIIKLDIADFEKCGNIWDLDQQKELAGMCRRELISGNRITYIFTVDKEFIGEISLVKNEADPDYTIPGRRIYISRLIVKPEFRRQGIGKRLLSYSIDRAIELGYSEMSIGVDLDNYPALKLYIDAGFDKIVFIGEDEYGRFVKLLKII